MAPSQFCEKSAPLETTPPISPLTGTLNQPVNSLMKESTWKIICRGVNELQLLRAAGIFCPFTLAHPSIPDPRHRLPQQMALLVPVCGDKETTTGGPDSNQSTSPHLPQSRLKIMSRAARIRAQKRCQGQAVTPVLSTLLKAQLERAVQFGMLILQTV